MLVVTVKDAYQEDTHNFVGDTLMELSRVCTFHSSRSSIFGYWTSRATRLNRLAQQHPQMKTPYDPKGQKYSPCLKQA